MSVEVIPVTGKNLITASFMSRWHTDRHRPVEKVNIRNSIRLAKQQQLKIHVLQINRRDYGYVAVNIHQLPDENPNKFYLLVDFLFVSKEFRGAPIDELEGMTASTYLMSIVYEYALEAARFFPFDNIVLFPADPKLVPFYSSLGYAPLPKTKGFMYLSLRTV